MFLCVGASAAGPSETATVTKTVSAGYVFEKGGVLMYVLSAMSVLGVALTIYYFLILREEQVSPLALRRQLTARIAEGSWGEVRELCRETPCALAEIAAAAVNFVETTPDYDAAMLKDIIEGEGMRQGVDIQVQPQYLLDLAVVSPMGSVFGMIGAFHAVAMEMSVAKPVALAGGVSEALFTTAGGLIIGIPAMVFYGHFRSRASKLVSRLESAAGDLLTAFLKARQK